MKYWERKDKSYEFKDKNAFLFNLTSKKIFKVTQPEFAIRCDKELAICFGKKALSISNDRKTLISCPNSEEENTGYGIELDEKSKNPLTGNRKIEFRIDWRT